jgi:class 3 adenylate cyclase
VFTDIVDSTMLGDKLGDDAWVALVKDHEFEIRRITSKNQGIVVKMLGDGSMLAFESARAAVRAALEIQTSTDDTYAVRIGIHAGEVIRSEGDLLGITVNKAARVASIADGGQVLISSLVAELVGTMTDIVFNPPETVTLSRDCPAPTQSSRSNQSPRPTVHNGIPELPRPA